MKRWIFENNPVLPRLYERYDQLVYFVLPIAEMDYYDLNPTPPVFKHFDLISGEVSNGFVGERFSKQAMTCAAWSSTDKLSFGLIFEKAAIVLLLLVHRLLLLHYDFFLYLDRGGRNLLKLEVKTELLCATLIFHI